MSPPFAQVYAKRTSPRKRDVRMDTIAVEVAPHQVTMIAWRMGYAGYHVERMLDTELTRSWGNYRQRMGWNFTDPHAPGEMYMRFREHFTRGWWAQADAERVLRGREVGYE